MGERYLLASIPDYTVWKTHLPQGLQYETLQFQYVGAQSAVVGYIKVHSQPIWFVGLNLPYHAFLTNDTAAASILAGLFNLPLGQSAFHEQILMKNYTYGPNGYGFRYELDEPRLLVAPFAAHDGIEVRVDGNPVPPRAYEQLLAFQAPEGRHTVNIHFRPTLVHGLGWLVSGAAWTFLLVVYLLPTLPIHVVKNLLRRLAGQRQTQPARGEI
jgi:hypothetical protein